MPAVPKRKIGVFDQEEEGTTAFAQVNSGAMATGPVSWMRWENFSRPGSVSTLLYARRFSIALFGIFSEEASGGIRVKEGSSGSGGMLLRFLKWCDSDVDVQV